MYKILKDSKIRILKSFQILFIPSYLKSTLGELNDTSEKVSMKRNSHFSGKWKIRISDFVFLLLYMWAGDGFNNFKVKDVFPYALDTTYTNLQQKISLSCLMRFFVVNWHTFCQEHKEKRFQLWSMWRDHTPATAYYEILLWL